MKRIVVKMRHLKKLIGNELLQLALMLSLLRVDPGLWPSSPSHNNNSAFSSGTDDDVWTETRFGEMDSAPDFRLNPKSMDSVLERFQNDILDELNSLGRFSRVTSFRGAPVHIEAYIVNTDGSGPSGGGGSSSENEGEGGNNCR